MRLRHTQFPLHPNTPEEGLLLEELFRGRGIDLEASKKRMKGLMAEEGLAYGDRQRTFNSRLAQERPVLEERRMRAAVDADWARSRALNVTGVPTFVIDGEALVGAQPYTVLEKFVLSAGARRRQ